jgi:hypothetical protein
MTSYPIEAIGGFFQYEPFLELGLLVLVFVVAIVGALLKEFHPFYKRWVDSRSGFEDPHQTPYVRGYAKKLSSRRRENRLAAVEMLGQMNDRTAVPALVRVIEKYREDGPFVEQVVRVLGRMGDDRALPTLKALTSGRHHSLMQAAREAVEAIEPRSVLLRSSSAPVVQANTLLRPARGSQTEDSERLLRAGTEVSGS